AVRLVVAIAVRNENQIWRRTHPYSAETHGDRAAKRQAILEYRPLLRLPVAVRVLKDQDLVLRFTWRLRVVRILQHPEAATIIDRVRHRLDHVRLRRDHLHAEAFRHLQRRRGSRWRE